MRHSCTRRAWLQGAAAGAAGLSVSALRRSMAWADVSDSLPPVRVVTRGPKHHWFGYYDKLQFGPDDRLLLGMEVDFEHRTPRPDDVIRVGMVDLRDGDRWIDLGQSTAWCWQQGCMLQWRPGSESQIVWNDREDGSYVSRILDLSNHSTRTVPHPIYAISPDGRWAITLDFGRVQDVRPGYGYVGIADPNANVEVPRDSGVFLLDLEMGTQELIVPIAEIVAAGRPHPSYSGAKHYVNHLLWNTDGTRIEFLHRWLLPDGSRRTRMLTANPDGTALRVLDDNGMTSHFIWRDPRHILAWSKQPSHGAAFYLFEDADDGSIEAVGPDAMKADGHCSYLPGSAWILNDTYPDRAGRNQRPYLYHVASGRVAPLGQFYSPPEYTGEWRCDTHPRHSRRGTLVSIDSPHADAGRQLHLIDIAEIVRG